MEQAYYERLGVKMTVHIPKNQPLVEVVANLGFAQAVDVVLAFAEAYYLDDGYFSCLNAERLEQAARLIRERAERALIKE